MSAASPHVRRDLVAQAMGLLITILGVIIILGVLRMAYDLFQGPMLTVAAHPKTGPTATDIGTGLARLIVKIGLLFLGSISGSLIANKGIHIYFAGAPTPQPRP